MRAVDPETLEAVWEAVKYRIPAREVDHPAGCHRPRISDRKFVFGGFVTRLVTGCCGETAEWTLDGEVSDTTLRARRDEWVEAGVFDELVEEALAAYDRIIGLDLSEVSVDETSTQSPLRG